VIKWNVKYRINRLISSNQRAASGRKEEGNWRDNKAVCNEQPSYVRVIAVKLLHQLSNVAALMFMRHRSKLQPLKQVSTAVIRTADILSD
jgi:hypothetical protein